MRTERVLLPLLILLACAAPSAAAPWSEPQPLASASGTPAVAVRPDGEALGLWAGTGGITGRIRSAAGTWGAPHTLSGTDQPVTAAGAFAPDGTAWAAWTEGWSGSSVYVASRPPGGEFGDAQLLSGSDQVTGLWVPVALATGTDGTVAVTWLAVTGVNVAAVRVAVAPPGGPFGAPETVSDPDQAADQEALFVHGDGSVTVAWISDSGRPSQAVWSATRSPDGTWAAPLNIGGPDARPAKLELAGSPSGAAIATWTDLSAATSEESGPYEVKIARRSAGGSWSAPATLTGAADWNVGVALTPAGDQALAWLEGDRLTGRRGSALDPVAPADAPPELASRPYRELRDVLIDGHGNALVLWSAGGQNDVAPAIFATPWQAGAPAPLPTEVITTDTDEDAQMGAAMDGAGRTTLLWATAAPGQMSTVRDPIPDYVPPSEPAPAPSTPTTTTPSAVPPPPAATPPAATPPAATPRCRVPALAGRTPDAARRALTRAGCRVGTVKRAATRRRSLRGRVVRQSPTAGAVRPAGARVSLTVGRRPGRRG